MPIKVRPHYFAVLLSLFVASAAADTSLSPQAVAFFEKKIRPVLATHCYQCHSASAAQLKGGLLLDSRAGIRKGGESGAVISPEDPESSLLIKALRYADDAPAMPPRKQLPAEVIADFVEWIKLGLPDPRDGAAVVIQTQGIDIEKGRQFWSFVPPRATPIPAVRHAQWPLTPEDRYLLAALESRGMNPAPAAGPYALARRLYLDLIGLPPSPEDLQRFAALPTTESQQSESAYLAEVDRLLSSPHFGERWGRHWLDIARFAETSGRQINFNYPQAWRYRDWVIQALNADKPFDQFVREQIAGDLLPAASERQRAEQQIATGFLAIGPKAHSEREALQFEMDLVDEQIDATSQAFLGLTVACARCHDHKFDPIPQRDYYALAGIFRSTETCYGTIRIIQSLSPSPLIELPAGQGLLSALAPLPAATQADLQQQLTTLEQKFADAAKGGKPTTGVEFNVRGTLQARLAAYTDNGEPKLLTMGVRDRSVVIDSPLFARGEIDKPVETVPRGLVEVVSREGVSISPQSSGRLELAQWLSSRDNPLTARVFVNRVWAHLFGRGLVPTPDNFGAAGAPPDHPELLDHLALEFMEHGWSLKWLVRRIVTGRAYRQSTQLDAKNDEADPDNIYLWRMSPARLDAEVIRDAILDAAGRLNRTPPVGSVIAEAGEDNSNKILRKLAQLDATDLHRAVYLPVIRDNVLESLALFDFADPSLVASQRSATNVPAQSLFLLNNPLVLAAADAAAARIMAAERDDNARLTLVYLLCLSRPPTETERSNCQAFLARYTTAADAGSIPDAARPTPAAWSALCQALLCTADFLHRP